MQFLITASVAVALLFTLSASGFAQRAPAFDCAGEARPPTSQPPACFDGTPHQRICVPVDKGVALEILDWGGAGKPRTMVMLTGYGDNAHVYDEIAYQFIDDFHVIGITRRGFLPSSQPETGYDVETRAHDDIEVLKYFGITKAVFVGHSLAGSELSKLGLRYKSYVDKLIYVDAFDLAKRFELPPIPDPPYTDYDGRSLQIFWAAQGRIEDILRPEPSLCPSLKFDEKGQITGTTTPKYVGEQIFQGIDEKHNPEVNWADIDAQRLGIFNQPSVQGRIAYYWYLSLDNRRLFDARWPAIVQWYADTTARFRQPNPGKPGPVVYLLPDVPHYFFINDQAFVIRKMREFLMPSVGP